MRKTIKETLSIKWLFISLIVGLISYFSYSVHQVFFNENEYTYNRFSIPLGNRQEYFLKKHTFENQTYFYYIQPENEQYSTAFKTGYSIGESNINLEPYLDKKVYIYGDIKKGNVKIFQPKNDLVTPPIGITEDLPVNEQMVIRIKKIK